MCVHVPSCELGKCLCEVGNEALVCMVHLRVRHLITNHAIYYYKLYTLFSSFIRSQWICACLQLKYSKGGPCSSGDLVPFALCVGDSGTHYV